LASELLHKEPGKSKLEEVRFLLDYNITIPQYLMTRWSRAPDSAKCALFCYGLPSTDTSYSNFNPFTVDRQDSWFLYTPKTHKYFSDVSREGVFLTLLIFRRLFGFIPRDIRLMILDVMFSP
jgi:hypothetical protein